jgi:hypothetical protein
MTFGRRVMATALSVALVSGSATLCAGWIATPEARMACCSGEGRCPMHDGDHHGSNGAVTQAQADSCCASSEQQNSGQRNTTVPLTIVSAILGPGTVLPASVPALVTTDRWRMAVPIPTTLLARHVLLSVFLV